MRVLMAAMGSRGDVQPVLALALALRARGHDVRVAAPPDFQAWAGELGIPFTASGRPTEAALREHAADMGAHPARILRIVLARLAREVPGWVDGMLEAARGCHVIVSAERYAASSVAERLGIPCVAVSYAPTMLRSAYHPPYVARGQGMPRWANALAWTAAEALVHRTLTGPVNASRATLGLPGLASIPRHFERLPFLLACDPVVAPAPPDWKPLDVTTTGPWFYEDPAPLDAAVEAFLAAGPPPVFVGFGSSVAQDAARMTRVIVEGAGRRRLLLSRGWAGIGAAGLPASVMVVPGSIPHAKLFPRVAAVVHHGGAGTTAEALRAGVPQVTVPHWADQCYYAHRLGVLGIAPAGIPVRRLTARRLGEAVEATLAMPPGPRLRAALRLREGDGVARAVSALEALAPQAPASDACCIRS